MPSRCPPSERQSWKAEPAGAPQQVTAMVEDSNGVLWLESGTLQRFEPATGRFIASTLNRAAPDGRTGNVRRSRSNRKADLSGG